MRKILLGILIGVLSFSFLCTGCSKQEKATQDQTNAALGNVSEVQGKTDERGWTPHLRLTYEGDKIKEVYYDYLNDKSVKKSEDADYNKNMKEKTGVSAKEAMEKLRQDLIDKQNAEEVSTVTGATQTSDEFKSLAKEAMDKHKAGTTK